MSYGLIDEKPYAVDIFEEIQKERIRLEGIVNGPEFLKNKQWGWMKGWLQKTNEEHYKENKFNSTCNVCGHKARFFLKMDFSFCDEYGCGMKICSKCLKKLYRIFKSEVKKKVGKC